MRTALILLLLLALAAIPGSLFPQRMADPNGVSQWRVDNPDLFPFIDSLSLFDVYVSPWFSAIYLLLFLSLIGCVIPRIKHHFKALRAEPPRTPARLSRLADYRSAEFASADAEAAASEATDLAEKQLRKLGYRTTRYSDARMKSTSVSAERGYWRETGNLVFHIALVGVLVTVGVGGGFAYSGQQVIIEGSTVVNTLLDYSSMNRGRFVPEDSLKPYSMTLDSFDVTYVPFGEPGSGQAGDFSANMTVREPDGTSWRGSALVNHPLNIAGDKIYLMGNGYAPMIVVRNSEGVVIFREAVPFLPQDTEMTSLGVVKIPDGMPQQIGMHGFFYPTQVLTTLGTFASIYPALTNPVITLNVFVGDLGIDDGTPRSIYVLDTTAMTQIAGGHSGVPALELAPGETAELPNGLGSITFENVSPLGETDLSQSVKRFVALQVHHDNSTTWVLAFALLALAGLMLALFVPRRRMWVKSILGSDGITVEYAGLARGDDPTLGAAVEDFAAAHGEKLASKSSMTAPEPTKVD